MTGRAMGVIFYAMAIFLLATRHIVAAIYGSNLDAAPSKEEFDALLNYTGGQLFTFQLICLIVASIFFFLDLRRKE